jgi:HD-like signal output (HDOD) protein
MSSSSKPEREPEEIGLIVQQDGSQQQALVKYLTLMLNYLYGFNIVIARSMGEASALLMQRTRQTRCVFVVQDQDVSKTTVTALSLRGETPLFLLLPEHKLADNQEHAQAVSNVSLFAWEQVTKQGGPSLRELIEEVFERNGIGGLFDGSKHLSYRVLLQRVQRRLKHLKTLPTLPEVVLRIVEVINDPYSSADELEEVLLSDPAIVHKLIQIVNTTSFAGSGHRSEWSLKEAIVRLGRKKVGSIALQIKLMNSLVKPKDSQFDLRRFWIHSVGCAMVADKLCESKLLPVEGRVESSDYWIASLLHDVGTLVLGFFFWSYFERVLQNAQEDDNCSSIREAESRLGDVVTHEQVGQLLLMRAEMSQELVRAVSTHHEPEPLPSPLICLVHLADNICKDLGLSYMAGEKGVYSDSVLRAMDLNQEILDELKDSVRHSVVNEIKDLVERCLR